MVKPMENVIIGKKRGFNMNLFIEKVISEVKNIYKDRCIDIIDDEIKVVWFCKTLQNGKVLIAIIKPGFNDYYEATYNGDRKQIYLDIYKKSSQILLDCSTIEESLF